MRRATTTTSALITAGVLAFALAGCSGGAAPAAEAEPAPAPQTTVTAEAPEVAEPAETTFVDGVLTTPEYKIAITDQRVIPVGEIGNEYGDAPVLAIFYDVTNLSSESVSTTNFIYHFNAFQDNDPNVVNELEVGSHPDPATLDQQLLDIKEGGTAAGATAFTLSDTTTPVELVASDDLFEEVGRLVVNIS